MVLTISGQNAVSQQQYQLMSDREADELRGKVRQVIVESADLNFENGKFIEGEKETSSVTEYDEFGNRLKQVFYTNGYLSSKRIYGTLDGEKISRDEDVENENVAVFSVYPTKKEEKPKDSRFSFKYKYKYDENGNRIEEVWIQNTGEIWIRDTITFDGNRNVVRQVRRHRGEDTASSTNFFKYDERGFLTEEIIELSGDIYPPEKYDSHEFDSNGNWIKRIVSKKKRDGSFEPFLATYRKITYFNQK